ncbi:arylsulfotransferase family protein [uncultured Tateyamaria sp.]|uniref:arylsulfotransferase family protein n=1 Tax=uncultured Tateyamaria sp. TaxID=455651 RepID=UPI0026301C99|nr:arylsulfotransferase family protein [uncultured Tateyamaria sp.]
MERVLFGNVKAWLVLFLAILGLFGSVMLSSLVLYRVEGGQRLPLVTKAALNIARFPHTVVQLARGELKRDNHVVPDRFPDEPTGFSILEESIGDPQYLLVSRYDGNIGRSVVELLREGEADVLHRWVFDNAEDMSFESEAPFISTPIASQSHTMRTVHPWLGDDGGLFVKVHFGAMYRVGACSDVEWVNSDFMFHHALEQDAYGNFWSVGSGQMTPEVAGLGFNADFVDNRAIQLSPQGEVLFDRSVMEIIINAGLLNLVNDYDAYQIDPIHLNDVQPVFEDGQLSRRGDIYLSLSHLNMLMLYRPATDELVWWTQDYMMQQHDIDIIAPDVVQIFDNRKRTGPQGSMTISTNEIVRYHLPEREGDPVFAEPMREADVRTLNQGLADQLPGNGIMMEDTNAGRLIKFSETGKPQWTYLNRSDDGRVWTLNWSRYISAATAESALEQLKEAQCNI